jgi:hypothetical protein
VQRLFFERYDIFWSIELLSYTVDNKQIFNPEFKTNKSMTCSFEPVSCDDYECRICHISKVLPHPRIFRLGQQVNIDRALDLYQYTTVREMLELLELSSATSMSASQLSDLSYGQELERKQQKKKNKQKEEKEKKEERKEDSFVLL